MAHDERNAAIAAAARMLLTYCRRRDWAGHDPYDALNSRWLSVVPALNTRWPRLLMTQSLKRSPINVRPLLLIPRTQNPKALALFLAAVLKYPSVAEGHASEIAGHLIDRLIALRSENESYWCWGYSFPWQTRTLVVPRGTPNLVCTTFVADALLDAYDRRRDPRCLHMATSAADYIVNELYRTQGAAAGFSYPLPSMPPHIHNANLLGAALLCRIARLTDDPRYLAPALRVARYSASRQHDNGSWPYGEGATQQWIDNFHTGYNLCALQDIGRFADTDEFGSRVARGFEFYRAHFFRADGAPRYFHDRTYPIDIHCAAQSILTMSAFAGADPQNLHLAHTVCKWTLNHLRDRRGFFYYRMLRVATIRTSYMRWSQAWMLLALCTLLCESTEPRHVPAEQDAALVV
jgi:hypothetical protein